jgi:CheY-like chemotaxis protein
MKKKIFIIEDDLAIIDVTSYILQEEGYDVYVRTRFPGMEFIEELMPDLIILDMLLPDVGGPNICKRIKKNRKTRMIPVVLVSAYPKEQIETTAKSCDANGYLTKPYDIQVFVNYIKQFTKDNYTPIVKD